ncbi:aminoacyl-tRNA hydrolase [bacterium]|nr:MAG: aminoacyl-tRNA hydrolase [bacterium]
MPLIAGLGNIGAEYDGTRHNIGFRVIYGLAEKLGFSFKTGRGPYYIANGLYNGKKTILILPTTFMNRSGSAVQHAMNYFQIPIEEVLVCTDDINLPTGKLRLKPSGSAGGHNGLSDIIYQLHSDAFARLRFGVGNEFRKGEQAKYVLSRFAKDEEDVVSDAVSRSIEAITTFLNDGVNKAMNEFNS